MPTIPYHFEESEHGYLEELGVHEENGLRIVRWKYMDLPVCHDAEEHYPSIESIVKNTPAFQDHREYGFTLGQYSEFFVVEDWGEGIKDITFFIGRIEVSLGDATPLAQYIYDGHEIRHYHPPVSDLKSIRLIGVDASSAEAVLLYSIIKLKKIYGMRLSLFSYHQDFVAIEEDESTEAEDESRKDEEQRPSENLDYFRAAIIDLTPLRLFTKGLSEIESTTAFLQFFRVLEYFCLVPYESDVEILRRKSDLGTRDFLIQLQKIVSKDERGLIAAITGRLADASLIRRAKQFGLIDQAIPSAFCASFYDFRNSLVHAKSDRPSNIHTESLFRKDETAERWKEICEELALRALEEFGVRST